VIEEPQPDLPPDEPRHRATGYPKGLLPVLTFTVIVSLLAAMVLAVRLSDERSETDRLRDLAQEQRLALDALRAGLRENRTPLQAIQAAVEELRALEFRTVVTPDVLTSAQLAERVKEALTEDLPREEFERTQLVLEAFGLVEPGQDIYGALTASQEEQVGGYYDTESKELVVEGQEAAKPTPLDQILLAHELTHALTDQHFDLSRLDKLVEQRRDDEVTAFQSLAEGDAQLVSELYATAVLTDEEGVELRRQALGISTDSFDELPAFMQEATLFPYTSGLTFVRALHRQGGFAAIDAAYRDPPASTEQILHPSRYIVQRDEPRRVTMPAVGTALGDGWERLDHGGIGELDLRLIADHGASFPRADALRAAAGWDGGSYLAFRSGSEVTVAVLTVFDSQTEAREAATLFGRWLPLRFHNRGESFESGSGSRGWVSDDGAGLVVRSGDEMVLLLGPDRGTVERAAGAFS